MQIQFTDAEQAFADSPAGRRDIAAARRNHDASESHKGLRAAPWTDAHEANAVRRLATADARGRVVMLADGVGLADRTATARAAAETARQMRDDRTRNAWKGR